jgi:tryptophan synthase alpha chain
VTPSFGPKALVAAAFSRCRSQHRAALIAFLVAGDPNQSTSAEFILAAAQGGADLIELGIPFSDPLADGPTISSAAQRSLRAGTTFDRTLALARTVRRDLHQVPLIAFTYYNVILTRGIDAAGAALGANGFAGAIIPDLPLEEAGQLIHTFASFGLAVPLLVAPSTPPQRAATIATAASGFIYVVSRMGVTGTQTPAGETQHQIRLLRSTTDTPIAVGFGVSTPQDVCALAEVADGVIVGSALIDRATQASSTEEAVDKVRSTCAEFSAACARSSLVG